MKHTLFPTLLAALAVLTLLIPLHALDLTNGVMQAIPTPNGKAPVIDGDLADWDLSAAEPIWIAPETAKQLHATVALMYDKDALYVGAEVSLPGRGLHNPNNPVDAFWWGDVLELRVAADPSLPAPLSNSVVSDRIAHLTFWKNSDTGKDYLHIGYGVNIDKGHAVNPPDSEVVIRQYGTDHYIVEARVPWSALHAPGGVNPFAPGQKMTAVWSPHWGGETQVAALYRQNPGSFAFNQPQTWGQVEFSPTGHLKSRHETMAQLLARFAVPAKTEAGVPILVTVPSDGLKVSVNILGPHGEVLRELMGGESHAKGPLTVHWDGKDQWGMPMTPGQYHWGAYFSQGLEAQYVAGVGKTADPYYDTLDGKGGWGGDHSNPIDVAADATGLYFLWPVAESGRAIVKTDYQGKVLWRKTPFVGGGFGPFYAVASSGKYVYLTLGDSKPQLIRLDAATGQTLTWGTASDAQAATPISDSEAIKLPAPSSPLGSQPESVGVAANAKEVFASVYSRSLIQVLDPETGALTRTLDCPGPRGVCLDKSGNLYAVSYMPGQEPKILVFRGAQGKPEVRAHGGLEAPWDVAVASDGLIYVSDGGRSQQIKVFSPYGGRPLRTWGRAGGRTLAGAYDPGSFLNPAGIALDAQGGLLVAESSVPKVMSRWDVKAGKPLAHWFGGPSYWDGTWPDSDNPRTVYYQVTGGFARANLSQPDWPQAYWANGEGDLNGAVIPTVINASNGRKYLVNDVSPNAVYLVKGDQMRPIASFHVYNQREGNKLGHTYLEVWQDKNGDGQIQPDEVTDLDTVGGKPLPNLADWGAPTNTMTPNGDIYIETQANKILKIPAAGFHADGSIRWNLAAARYAVPTILPASGDSFHTGPRGQVGLRVDRAGNIYTCFAATVGSVTPELTQRMAKEFPGLPPSQWGVYATKELADKMHEGLGHTGESNAVKFAKFDKNGHLLWLAGRKATAAAGLGEMYHFWSLAGLVGDDYIAGASEWGPMYVYTQDGFFVDTLFNNPGQNPPPGPYTFGSETGTGRLQYFPKQDQLWAYAVGMAYQVKGFSHGKVEGEHRASGTVTLDKVYEEGERLAEGARQAASLQIVPLTGDPLADAGVWSNIPISTLHRNEADLATVQIGYDGDRLYARLHVHDDTPLQNAADRVNTAFKGGDTAGIVLGPGTPHVQPGLGDVRVMAAMINGQPHLIAMKAVTGLAKNPEDYFTPSSGHVRFDYVGEVPDGKVLLTPDPDGKGYTAAFSVPRSFLELPLTPGAELSVDVEVRLSGQGQQGPQTASRNYLFTPLRSETSMTSDIPTEARLYPQYWGRAMVK